MRNGLAKHADLELIRVAYEPGGIIEGLFTWDRLYGWQARFSWSDAPTNDPVSFQLERIDPEKDVKYNELPEWALEDFPYQLARPLIIAWRKDLDNGHTHEDDGTGVTVGERDGQFWVESAGVRFACDYCPVCGAIAPIEKTYPQKKAETPTSQFSKSLNRSLRASIGKRVANGDC